MCAKVEESDGADFAFPIWRGLKSRKARAEVHQSYEDGAVKGMILAHSEHGVASEDRVDQVPADESDVRRVDWFR